MAEEHVDSPHPPRGPRNRPGTAFQGVTTKNEIVERLYINSNSIAATSIQANIIGKINSGKFIQTARKTEDWF